jgi:hypothetical protein
MGDRSGGNPLAASRVHHHRPDGPAAGHAGDRPRRLSPGERRAPGLGPVAAELQAVLDSIRIEPCSPTCGQPPESPEPTWTPDGARIIFTKVVGRGFLNPTMMTIPPDGTGLASATDSGEMFGTHPRLRPTTDGGEAG